MPTISKLLAHFNDVLAFLYEHDKDGYVAGSREAMEYGDYLIENRPNLVSLFTHERHDLISSDREATAFGFAVVDLYGDFFDSHDF